MRIGTFPPYLVLYVKRYYQDANDWSYKKMEVLVDMPDTLDLEPYRAQGVQPGEVIQPEVEQQEQQEQQQQDQSAQNEVTSPQQSPQINEGVVQQLMDMGFSQNGCRRAVIMTGNAGIEAAMNWILEHQEDADFNSPIEATELSQAAPMDVDSNQQQIDMITGMGFNERQAQAALKATGGDVERAGDWLLTRMDNLQEEVEKVLGENSSNQQQSQQQGDFAAIRPATQQIDNKDKSKFLDGPAKYKLLGFVSHIGANTACGHYVAHVRKDDKWVIFNDEKVAVSSKVPKDVGYMYIYQRQG
eukprot:TRINITY_DN7449_c1_g2_i6.p1 TRINITY_DN7449_c1_g2~~TRINITY_DN7449_c1_g2_i6.p1  ORF type:complete len:301 (+),score=57.36 TRINITY_DN7449_c1_g2_i6:244-1146(+)